MEVKAGYKQSEVGVIPEEWEVKRLFELTTEIGDGIHATPKYVTSSEYFFINGNNLATGSITINENTKCVSEQEYNKLHQRLNDTTILLSINGTIGNLAFFNSEKVVLGKSAAYINLLKNTSQSYVFYALQSNITTHYFEDQFTGTTIRNLSLESLRNTPIPIPPLSEQDAIAAALSDVDALISALDKLIAKKRGIKQATMQQLLTGKMRLPGFEGEWEVKRLGECFTFLSTGSNSRSELSEYGDTKYIHYGDIHTKWSLVLDCKKDTIPFINSERVKSLPLLENGDLVIADASEDYEGVGSSVEIKNLNGQKIVAGLHTLLLRGDKNVIADGYKAYITSIQVVKNSLIRIATGTSVYGISKRNLRSVEIPLPPTTKEQQAIAAILSDMDAEIAALEARREKTCALKLGMMQELLTGKTRLV